MATRIINEVKGVNRVVYDVTVEAAGHDRVGVSVMTARRQSRSSVSAASAALLRPRLQAAGRHNVIACVRRPIDHLTLERPEDLWKCALRALTDPAQATPVPLGPALHQNLRDAFGWAVA